MPAKKNLQAEQNTDDNRQITGRPEAEGAKGDWPGYFPGGKR